jgi:ATP-dependent Lon protease
MTVNSPLPNEIELPLLPLRDVVVFPHMVIPLFVGRPKSIKALEMAMESGRGILLVAQKTPGKDEPHIEDLYGIGCIANILQMLKLPDGTVKVLVKGKRRARIGAIESRADIFVARATPVAGEDGVRHEVEALRRAVIGQFDQCLKLNNRHENLCSNKKSKKPLGPCGRLACVRHIPLCSKACGS